MKKEVILMKGAQEFFATLDGRTQTQFERIAEKLSEEGRLEYPYGEKIKGHANLLAIRITHGQNVRFFYCYDNGQTVFILTGYEKKTEHVPIHELKRAIRIKKELGL